MLAKRKGGITKDQKIKFHATALSRNVWKQFSVLCAFAWKKLL